MELWLESCIVVLAVLVLLLCIRLHLAKKVALEIHAALPEKLNTDTNTPITLSCRDKDLCLLADTLNQSLEQLRAMQHCFKQGNTQLQTSITSISHDLRTPLTTICGYLELLEKEPLSAVSRQYVAIIRECTKVMTQLTEELFRYSVVLSVPLAQPLQEVSVNRILEGSIAAMYVVLKRHRITPDITITDHTVLRTLDPSALSRVFSNLLNNAVKYSDGDLSITLSEDGIITFSNTAAALSEVEVGRLFDRFYTVENAKNATGLGLSLHRIRQGNMHFSHPRPFRFGSRYGCCERTGLRHRHQRPSRRTCRRSSHCGCTCARARQHLSRHASHHGNKNARKRRAHNRIFHPYSARKTKLREKKPHHCRSFRCHDCCGKRVKGRKPHHSLCG